MIELLLLYKLFNIIGYGLVYKYLYKKLNRIEEKILYWNFFILFFIGGSISSLIFNYTDIIFPSSGMKFINTNFLSWSIYFIIIFLLPTLSILVSNKIFKIVSSKDIKFKSIKRNNIFFILFFILTYIILTINLNDILFNQIYIYKGYSASLEYRYNLHYSNVFIFIVKVLPFVFLLSLSIEYFYKKKKIKSFLLFIMGMIIYGIIDNFIFISKLYFIGFLFSYIIFLLINLEKKYFLPISVGLVIFFILFYFYNMGDNYEANYIEPILKGITRFTIAVPYYIEYYMHENFDMKIYFYSLLTGDTIISPNIKVFSTMYNSNHLNIQGSLASGIFTYNYANFGMFTIVKSLFEVTILIGLYAALIAKNNITSIKISVFFLMVFGIINYSFITTIVNPLIGFIYFIIFYSIKDIFFIQQLILIKGKNR